LQLEAVLRIVVCFDSMTIGEKLRQG